MAIEITKHEDHPLWTTFYDWFKQWNAYEPLLAISDDRRQWEAFLAGARAEAQERDAADPSATSMSPDEMVREAMERR